jgi:hypothetical protein
MVSTPEAAKTNFLSTYDLDYRGNYPIKAWAIFAVMK